MVAVLRERFVSFGLTGVCSASEIRRQPGATEIAEIYTGFKTGGVGNEVTHGSWRFVPGETFEMCRRQLLGHIPDR